MNNRNLIKILLVLIILIGSSCWCLEGDPDAGMELTPKPVASDTPTPSTPLMEAVQIDHCAQFETMEMNLVIHSIKEGDKSFTMYVKMTGGVPGLEKLFEGDESHWEYSAKIGGLESVRCSFEAYAERLFCFFPITQGYYNTAQPFSLFVNECDEPIFGHPNLSLIVEMAPEPPVSACGVEPASCGADHETWCSCDGGLFSGCVGGTPVCFYP